MTTKLTEKKRKILISAYTKIWKFYSKKVAEYNGKLKELETHSESITREVKSWPKWKRDIEIGLPYETNRDSLSLKDRRLKDKAKREAYDQRQKEREDYYNTPG